MSDFEKLGDVLGNASPHRGSAQAALADAWPDVVGEEIAANSVPLSLRAGKLVVATSSPAWAHTLQMMSSQLRDRLNRTLHDDMVKELVFRTAGWGSARGEVAPEAASRGRAGEPAGDRARGASDGGTAPEGAAAALDEAQELTVQEVERSACDPELGRKIAAAMRASMLLNTTQPRTPTED